MAPFSDISPSSWIHRLETLAQDVKIRTKKVLQQKNAFSIVGTGAGGDQTLIIDDEADYASIGFRKVAGEIDINTTAKKV